MTKLVGIDACPTGWFVVAEDTAHRKIEWGVLKTFSEAVCELSDFSVIAVDIPIGLPDAGPRECDLAARKFLGAGKTSSVFPAPLRCALGSTSHAEASQRRKAVEGKGMSIQAFAVLPKISEVDSALRRRRNFRDRVFEIHPEVTFAEMAGRKAMAVSKKRAPGRLERIQHLQGFFSPATIAKALTSFPAKEVAKDDVLDSFAALWSARRIYAKQAVRMPSKPECDSEGLDMAIWR